MIATVRRYPALLSLLLGAAAACGFAPLGLWPLTLACFAAWMILIHTAPTLQASLWRGWLFGVGHFTVNNNWIKHAFDYQDAMPPVLGYVAVVALALYLAVYPMLAAGLAWKIAGRTPRPDAPYVLIFGATWIATEWLRGTLFTGYAWDPIGVIWLPLLGVARIAAITGTYALSGLTIAAAGSLLLLFQRRWIMPAIATGVILIAALIGPAATPAPSATRVRVVQPNIGLEGGRQDDAELMLATLSRYSGTPVAAPRLIVWPEGAMRDYLEDGYPPDAYRIFPAIEARRRIARLLGPRDILLTGGNALKFDAKGKIAMATNSVFSLDAAARLRGRYDKAHLVPYGEYLPMRPLLSAIGLSRVVPGDIDFDNGPGPMTLDFPGFGGIGVQICYEIVFSGQVVNREHRPRLLFNPSNDAWFGTWGPPQHLAQARMRSVEEGMPIVRATPTGISAIVAANGRLLATVPHGVGGAIELPMPMPLAPTLFARTGNIMAAIVAGLLLLLAVAIRKRAR